MDIDPSDLLNTNVFIKNPELEKNISKDNTTEFRKFYEKDLYKQNEKKLLSSLDLRNNLVDDTTDPNNLLITQKFDKNNIGNAINSNNTISRSTREIKTLISVDSRDRNKLLYSKPNNFKTFLNKTYLNVKSIKLVSLEFPNTNAVINSTNRQIYWRNNEDIDLDFTITTNGIVDYPIYTNNLRIGSYIASTLQTEIISKINSIRRKQGQSNGNSIIGDYHHFVVTLDNDTDVVTFTSLILQQLSNNPISTIAGTGTILVFATNHGYNNNDSIYMDGIKTVAGIEATVLEGFYIITVLNSNTFTFEVNVKASVTIGNSTKGGGGGNVVRIGKPAPFQLLWGQENNTVAQNIGFPLENSSQIMYTNINTPFETIFQMLITTTTVHGLIRSYNYIGHTINIGTLNSNSFVSYKSYTILDIPSTTTILVQTSDNTVANSLVSSSGFPLISIDDYIQFNNTLPILVYIYQTYQTQSFLITTTTPHNYTFTNINSVITLYNTVDPTITNDTNYDGDYIIGQLPSPYQIIVGGILTSNNTHNNNLYGQLPKKDPITTNTVIINNITPNFIKINGLYYTKITCLLPHNLKIDLVNPKNNDQVYFYNVISTPVILTPQTVTSIIDNYTFLIQLNMTSLNTLNITKRLAYIGTGLITVYYPNHTFNSILSITNSSTPGQALVHTTVTHNLIVGNIVRISNTNAKSSTGNQTMNEAYNIVSIPTNDTFIISRLSGQGQINITTPGTTGIIGMTNDFYLYSCNSVGGVSSTMINNNLYTVRNVIDINTFTFIINNVFATSTETGGGSNVYISSLHHGFSGIQKNIKNNLLNRSINLEGENYCFITCPQLSTMQNTGQVKDIFARIILDQAPGYVCFNYLSNPKIFDTVPLSQLSELEFSVVNYDTTLYEFSDLDFSFTLEITEIIDTTDLFNHSSKRGVIDTH